MATLASRIKQLRQEEGLTQSEFGDRFGIVKSTVSLYESGKSNPNDQLKSQICEYYDISMDYLLGLTDERTKLSFQNVRTFSSRAQERGGGMNYALFKSGFGTDEIAERLGITEDLLDDMCSGSIIPSYDIIKKLSQICEKSTDFILGMREESRPKDKNEEYPFEFNPKSAERIKKAIEKYELGDDYWAELLSITEDEVIDLKEYGFPVHLSVLCKLADELHVSLDYLAGRSDAEKTLQKSEESLLIAYRNLNEENQSIAYGEVLKLKKDQEREEYLRSATSVAADEVNRGTGTDGLGK